MTRSQDEEAETVEPLTHESAAQTLEPVCNHTGLDSSRAELLRIGENAVFRLRKPVIVRIARTSRYADAAAKEVTIARWLEAADYPATRALDVEQPIIVSTGAWPRPGNRSPTARSTATSARSPR